MDRDTPEPTLDDVASETGWHCWRGLNGLLYARRLNSSPPRVVRGESPDDLREAIVKEEADMKAGVWAGITYRMI